MADDWSREEIIWRSGLDYARSVDRFWIPKSLVLGHVFWLILAINARFRLEGLLTPSILLGILLVYAIGLFIYIEVRDLKRARAVRKLRLKALLLQQYNSFLSTWLSVFTLIMALRFISRFSGLANAMTIGLLVSYAASLLFAIYWAPKSIPLSSGELAKAHRGDAKVLPYLLGCQGSVVGIGAFLSAWLLHDSSGLGIILVAALSSVSSLLLATFSVLGIYRAIVMMRSR